MSRVNALTLISLSLLLGQLTPVCANNPTQVSRFQTVDNTVQLSQSDPLQQIYQLSFPASIETVGKAIRFILMNTGYQLVLPNAHAMLVQQLFQHPIPLSLRSMGPITVEEGLLALAGNAYQLVIDPANRLISYRLKPKYQPIYQTNHGGL